MSDEQTTTPNWGVDFFGIDAPGDKGTSAILRQTDDRGRTHNVLVHHDDLERVIQWLETCRNAEVSP